MAVLTTNERNEAYRVGAMLKLADELGIITDTIAASPTQQVTRLTVSGSVGGSGEGTIILTVKTPKHISEALFNDGNGKQIEAEVSNNDNASTQATAYRAALNNDPDVAAVFGTVGGTSANIDATTVGAYENSTEIELSYALGTATGPTPASSTVQTPGVGLEDVIDDVQAEVGDTPVPLTLREQTAAALRHGAGLGVFSPTALAGFSTVADMVSATDIPNTYKPRAFYD